MNELNKRMFAIENLLSRLEEKMGPADEVGPSTTRPPGPTNNHPSTSHRIQPQEVLLVVCMCVEPIGPQ